MSSCCIVSQRIWGLLEPYFKIKGKIEEEKDSIIYEMVGYEINFQYYTYCNIVISSFTINLCLMAIFWTDFLSHILIIFIEFLVLIC